MHGGLDEHARTTLDAVCTRCWTEWSGDKAHVSAVAQAHLSPIVIAVNHTTPTGHSTRWVNRHQPRPVDVWPF